MPLKIIVIVKAIHFFFVIQNDPEKLKNHVEMLAKKRVDGFGHVFLNTHNIHLMCFLASRLCRW